MASWLRKNMWINSSIYSQPLFWSSRKALFLSSSTEWVVGAPQPPWSSSLSTGSSPCGLSWPLGVPDEPPYGCTLEKYPLHVLVNSPFPQKGSSALVAGWDSHLTFKGDISQPASTSCICVLVLWVVTRRSCPCEIRPTGFCHSLHLMPQKDC